MGVPLGPEHDAARGLHRLDADAALRREELAVRAVADAGQEARRALDVGEQEGHGPGRQGGGHETTPDASAGGPAASRGVAAPATGSLPRGATSAHVTDPRAKRIPSSRLTPVVSSRYRAMSSGDSPLVALGRVACSNALSTTPASSVPDAAWSRRASPCSRAASGRLPSAAATAARSSKAMVAPAMW